MWRARQQDEFERDTTQAWQTVRIWLETRNAKKLPDLRTLLRRTGGRQSVAEQRDLLQAIAKRHGLKLTKDSRKRTRV